MSGKIELLLAAEISVSTIILFLLLYITVRNKNTLFSENTMKEIRKRKNYFRAAIFLGVTAMAMLVIIEIFEALSSFDIIFIEKELEISAKIIQIFFLIFAQGIMLFLEREVIENAYQ